MLRVPYFVLKVRKDIKHVKKFVKLKLHVIKNAIYITLMIRHTREGETLWLKFVKTRCDLLLFIHVFYKIQVSPTPPPHSKSQGSPRLTIPDNMAACLHVLVQVSLSLYQCAVSPRISSFYNPSSQVAHVVLYITFTSLPNCNLLTKWNFETLRRYLRFHEYLFFF